MPIVIVNATESAAPTPNTLQSTGAAISQGATMLANGTYGLVTQPSDLTPLLAAPLALSSIVWSAGVALATTAVAINGRSTGDIFSTTIAGVTPSGYNGLVRVTVTGANTFTYSLPVNPGAETIPGTYTPAGQGELQAQVTTFFGQNPAQSLYVLELGPGDQTTGPATLGTWITANPGFFYSYLVPRAWDSSAGLLSLQAAYQGLTAKTYFFVTTTAANYSNYTPQMKGIVWLVETPGIPLTEFPMAALFNRALSYAPSSANRMTPFEFAFLFGVTPYPTVGNNALLQSIETAGGSYVGTGAEGGISTAIIAGGTAADGNDFSWWYSGDWMQINADLNVANAVINGSNNPLNPLYYSQPGVDTLQDVVYNTLSAAVSYGLANGSVGRATLDGPAFSAAVQGGQYVDTNVINAVPFITYTTENPSAYRSGIYGGLGCFYIPQRGFKQIYFNVNVTSLISQ